MNASDYFEDLENGLNQILDDPKFLNHSNQLAAWKLSTAFKRSYDESYLWNRALFLSSNGCQILLHGHNTRLAINSLKESAIIYENLFYISDKYDREFALMLSALCYDLAGYQANAVCLVRKITEYQFESEDDQVYTGSDNYILTHIRQVLLKNIVKAKSLIDRQLEVDLGLLLFNRAMAKWYDQVLQGTENDFLDEFDKVYRFYLNAYNIPVTQLLFLLRTRIGLYLDRSVWQNLSGVDHIKGNAVWNKYIRLLANDVYDGRGIKSVDKRLSKFEFWTSQLRAVQKGVLSTDESYVIQMPTSAGKTFIAELSILNALTKFPAQKCLYISPFRALTNEKEAELSDNLSKLGYSVSAISGNYEIDEFQDIILADTDVLIATPEKIDLLLRLNPAYFTGVSLAVVDEGHILGDISPRSSLLEFLIIRLKMQITGLKVLFISAVMPPPNADEYALWLSGKPANVVRSSLFPDSPPSEEWEPTRKLIGKFTWEGSRGQILYKNRSTQDEQTRTITPLFISAIIRKRIYANTFPDGNNKAQTSAALAYRLSLDGNTLVFCAQVRETKRVGDALLNLLDLLRDNNEATPAWFHLNRDRESYFYARKWYSADSYISRCLSHGIGIHFGDLPEAVRRSVEEDFVRGNLKVLISTNTIGQGLNFPIKNLIIHSTIMNAEEGNINNLEVRDFWNIIGRAGRAGMETEGQIVYNVKSPRDGTEYDRYTDKGNIPPANSIFFNVLAALRRRRISIATYENNIRILAEPYLLNLITEETIETDDEEVINAILNNSLFKIQCLDQNLDIEPIKKSFRGIFGNIKQAANLGQIRIYAETGLCLKSNQDIENFIEKNRELIAGILEEDAYLALLELILQMFDALSLSEMVSLKFAKIGAKFIAYLPVTILWIAGQDIDMIQAEWVNVHTDRALFNLLVAEGYYFRFPWLISAFQTLMAFKMNISREDFPEGVANLISFIKYGIDSPKACLLRSIGIKNRDVALLLAGQAGELTGRQLIRWTSNLNVADLEPLQLSRFDVQNILSVATKLTPQKFENVPDSFEFQVKGITYDAESMRISTLLEVGDALTYRRESTNSYDPFAIEILYGDSRLGYVPREYAKLIAVEIDINTVEYSIVVLTWSDRNDWDQIVVKMEKIGD
ncbi:DEAD/DEAH box helicase [Mucilaginibacter sp. NFX135]|uniref:DEAD/DEAH box helicase n=1 Tax=Mucilaginibacter sp. NFX135 TaxID=3402687 RepID=UPI003AFB568F